VPKTKGRRQVMQYMRESSFTHDFSSSLPPSLPPSLVAFRYLSPTQIACDMSNNVDIWRREDEEETIQPLLGSQSEASFQQA
jgi:hypothetical protein